MPIITLAQAKGHLRIDHSEQDDVLREVIDDAEALVFDYLHLDVSAFAPDQPWDAATLPLVIRRAIYLTIGYLWIPGLGDNAAKTEHWPTPEIKGLLMRFRDGVFA
jgi:hypothetical protein